MDLFLWRHANALSGGPDLERELSPAGHRQAAEAAEWLRANSPAYLRIFSSPALRARQTAAHFCENENSIELCRPLYENASPDEILAILGWPDIVLPALIISHEPTMGIFSSRLLAGKNRPSSFRTGALWWLRHQPMYNDWNLLNVIEPRLNF